MTATLRPDSKLSVAPSVYARAFGAEIVLLDFGRGEYFGLDEVGAEIWRGIENGRTMDEIAVRLAELFDVAREAALADTLALVQQMLDAALVQMT